jgi:hypothetical protein
MQAHAAGDRPSAATIVSELLLMRRRWRAARTLTTGRFLTESPTATTDAETFEEVRFAAAPDDPRLPLASASEYHMGSLSSLVEEPLDAPLLSPRGRAGAAAASRLAHSHRRTVSDGSVIVESSLRNSIRMTPSLGGGGNGGGAKVGSLDDLPSATDGGGRASSESNLAVGGMPADDELEQSYQ